MVAETAPIVGDGHPNNTNRLTTYNKQLYVSALIYINYYSVI